MGLIISRASAGTSGHADVTARWLTRGNFPLHQTIAFMAHRGHVVTTHPIRAISSDGAGRDAESQDGDSVRRHRLSHQTAFALMTKKCHVFTTHHPIWAIGSYRAGRD